MAAVLSMGSRRRTLYKYHEGRSACYYVIQAEQAVATGPTAGAARSAASCSYCPALAEVTASSVPNELDKLSACSFLIDVSPLRLA